MKEIIVKTQKQYDKIKDSFEGYIYIEGGTSENGLRINRSFNKALQYIRSSATIKSVYDSATIEFVYDSATIKSVYDSATIGSVSGSATIESVSGSATIEFVSGSATIKSVYDSATIKFVSGSATIESVYDSATIEFVYDSATIKFVSGSATIEFVSGSATIVLATAFAAILMVLGNASVTTKGFNIVRTKEGENVKLDLSKNTTFICLPKAIYAPVTFESYAKLYPVKTIKVKAIMYKTVHKVDGRYLSDKDLSFEYKIGKKKTEEVDPSTSISCTKGMHVSHKLWAIEFGRNWDDVALLECEVPIKDIVVSSDTDGKVRTSSLKVLREVPKEEW
jgi:hypothetical protein